MQYKLSLIMLLALSLSGCHKTLDLESGAYFNIKEFLISDNCHTKCGVPAKCEDKMVALKGIQRDFIPENGTFYLYDLSNDTYKIEIKIEGNDSFEISQFIMLSSNLHFKVKGIVKGYDQPTNFKCTRGFYLILDDIENIDTF